MAPLSIQRCPATTPFFSLPALSPQPSHVRPGWTRRLAFEMRHYRDMDGSGPEKSKQEKIKKLVNCSACSCAVHPALRSCVNVKHNTTTSRTNNDGITTHTIHPATDSPLIVARSRPAMQFATRIFMHSIFCPLHGPLSRRLSPPLRSPPTNAEDSPAHPLPLLLRRRFVLPHVSFGGCKPLRPPMGIASMFYSYTPLRILSSVCQLPFSTVSCPPLLVPSINMPCLFLYLPSRQITYYEPRI